MSRILVTGDAGFIGFHLVSDLLSKGHDVLGIDGITDYYDPKLKMDRLARLQPHGSFSHITCMLEDLGSHVREVDDFSPEIIVHLAAQAGVRYSLEAPDAYISSNVSGTLRLLELARRMSPKHLLVASTSSVYGGNVKMPFSEVDAVNAPVSLYAATKVATEALAHSFSHLWNIPTTCFRFFTVYGPWGRPDMALFKFVAAIREHRAIEVYGQGEMKRDFTYVEDLVSAVIKLIPESPTRATLAHPKDSVSAVAPFRSVNIAGGHPRGLLEFIEAIEYALDAKAQRRLLPMQPGDVVATWADTDLLRSLIGELPETSLEDGVAEFVRWYDSYYSVAQPFEMR